MVQRTKVVSSLEQYTFEKEDMEYLVFSFTLTVFYGLTKTKYKGKRMHLHYTITHLYNQSIK